MISTVRLMLSKPRIGALALLSISFMTMKAKQSYIFSLPEWRR